jgi:hypothetical protein
MMTCSQIETEVHPFTGVWRVTADRSIRMEDQVAIRVPVVTGNGMLIGSVIWTADGMMTGDQIVIVLPMIIMILGIRLVPGLVMRALVTGTYLPRIDIEADLLDDGDRSASDRRSSVGR